MEKWPHDDVLHAWWVQPGLLAGEYPGAGTPDGAATKLDLLLEAGVDTIIDLTTDNDGLRPYDDDLRSAAVRVDRRHWVQRFSCPIPDMGVIDTVGYDQIVDVIQMEIAGGHPVYVHCWGGRGRTSTVVGCLLANAGLEYEEVIARIADLRAGTRKAHIPCPETEDQRDVLRIRCNPDASSYGLSPELR